MAVSKDNNSTMELRKDPVTQSWMLVGDDDDGAFLAEPAGPCGWCSGGKFVASPPIYTSPGGQVRVYPHPHPLYRIEGIEARAAEGIYDRMRTVGAHELVLEYPTHDRHLT